MFHCNQCNKQTPRYDQKCTVCGSVMEEVTVRRRNSLCLMCCQYIPKNSQKCPTCGLRIITDYEKLSEERKRDYDRQMREVDSGNFRKSRNDPLPGFLQNIASDMNLHPSPPGQTSTSSTSNLELVQEPVESLPPFLANLAQENNLVPPSNSNSQPSNAPLGNITTNTSYGSGTLTQPNSDPEPIQVQIIDPILPSYATIVDNSNSNPTNQTIPTNQTNSNSNPTNPTIPTNNETTQIVPISSNNSSNDLATYSYSFPDQPWTLNVTVGPITINHYHNSCSNCDCSNCDCSNGYYYNDGRMMTYQNSSQSSFYSRSSSRSSSSTRHRRVVKRHHNRDGYVTKETTVECNVPNCRKCRELGVLN